MNEELSIIQCVAILGLMSMFGFMTFLLLSIPGADRRKKEEMSRRNLEEKQSKISCDFGGPIPFENKWQKDYDLIEIPYLENGFNGFLHGSCADDNCPKKFCAFIHDRDKCIRTSCQITGSDGKRRRFLYIKKQKEQEEN